MDKNDRAMRRGTHAMRRGENAIELDQKAARRNDRASARTHDTVAEAGKLDEVTVTSSTNDSPARRQWLKVHRTKGWRRKPSANQR